MKIAFLTAVLFLFCNTLIFAQSAPLEHETHVGGSHLALFNGATTNFSHDFTAYTIGLDYEYRLSELIGLGVLGEYIAAESDEFLLGIPFFLHPYKGLKFVAAPMAAFSEEHVEGIDASEKETNFAFRVGTGYDFHLGKISLGPSVNFDFGKTQALNYGLSLGFGF